MTSNQSFTNALKEGNLADALVIALSKATELKITTSVVSANDYYGKNPQLHPEDCLETKINLLKGEIENKIGENLLTREFYQNLQTFHLQEVLAGNAIIENNLETLQKLFTILAQIKQQELEINNPEIVSLHLGNQIPPSSPPPITYTQTEKKEIITEKKESVIKVEKKKSSSDDSAKKQQKQSPKYDWKTLTETMKDTEIIYEEKTETPRETEEVMEEEWGDLIIDEYIEQPPVVKSFFKEKNIKTDTTLVSNQKIQQLITDENNAHLTTTDNFDNPTPETDIIEHYNIIDDEINVDTKVISENEIKSFLEEESKNRFSLEKDSQLRLEKEENTKLSEKKEQNNINNQSSVITPLNDYLVEEDWGDLIEDNEAIIETKDDDWDEVVENLHEPKKQNQNNQENQR